MFQLMASQVKLIETLSTGPIFARLKYYRNIDDGLEWLSVQMPTLLSTSLSRCNSSDANIKALPSVWTAFITTSGGQVKRWGWNPTKNIILVSPRVYMLCWFVACLVPVEIRELSPHTNTCNCTFSSTNFVPPKCGKGMTTPSAKSGSVCGGSLPPCPFSVLDPHEPKPGHPLRWPSKPYELRAPNGLPEPRCDWFTPSTVIPILKLK